MNEWEKTFPLLGGGTIPWSVAELAYHDYAKRSGRSQSLQRLAERGGFHPSELDQHLPDWRARCDEVQVLRGEVVVLKARIDELTKGLQEAIGFINPLEKTRYRLQCDYLAEDDYVDKRVEGREIDR